MKRTHHASDGTLRQHQIERFDVAAHPASNLSPEGVGPLRRGAATQPNVDDAVASFKAQRRLFQSAGPNGDTVQAIANPVARSDDYLFLKFEKLQEATLVAQKEINAIPQNASPDEEHETIQSRSRQSSAALDRCGWLSHRQRPARR